MFLDKGVGEQGNPRSGAACGLGTIPLSNLSRHFTVAVLGLVVHRKSSSGDALGAVSFVSGPSSEGGKPAVSSPG